ncbi:hypothetical protein N5T80_02850 [Aliarcobacter cryaerophilus]|nr:hypothetical protein [Aliarcobacter cryaerophilus]MCT7545252.1 hypothetical protein [Aliarcobacter cryaerophilus]
MAVGMVKFYSEEKGYGFIYHKYRQNNLIYFNLFITYNNILG